MASRNDCADSGPCESADDSNLDLLVPSCDNNVFMLKPAQPTVDNKYTDSSRLDDNDVVEPDNDHSNSGRPVGNRTSDSYCRSSDSDHIDSYCRSANIDNTIVDESVDNRNTDLYCKSSDSYNNTDINKSAGNDGFNHRNSVDHDDDEYDSVDGDNNDYDSVDSDNDAYESVDKDKTPAAANHSASRTSRGRNSAIEDFCQQRIAPILNDGELQQVPVFSLACTTAQELVSTADNELSLLAADGTTVGSDLYTESALHSSAPLEQGITSVSLYGTGIIAAVEPPAAAPEEPYADLGEQYNTINITQRVSGPFDDTPRLPTAIPRPKRWRIISVLVIIVILLIYTVAAVIWLSHKSSSNRDGNNRNPLLSNKEGSMPPAVAKSFTKPAKQQKLPRQQRLVSAKYKTDLALAKVTKREHSVSLLAMFENQLVIGGFDMWLSTLFGSNIVLNTLHVYTTDGDHVATFNTGTDNVLDVAWLSRDRLVYSTQQGVVVLESPSGKTVQRIPRTNTRLLSASRNNTVYVGGNNPGLVTLLSNKSVTWSEVDWLQLKKPNPRFESAQFVEVRNNPSSIVWVLEQMIGDQQRRVHLQYRDAASKLDPMWRDVRLQYEHDTSSSKADPMWQSVYLQSAGYTICQQKLIRDGRGNVLLFDRDYFKERVFVFDSFGKRGRLMFADSSRSGADLNICSMDVVNQLLYIGTVVGDVLVFALVYETE